MKIAGIIAEYNPFHTGHKYHIEETKRITGADKIIVIMSGDFVQRGEPAIVDKYLRTRMALESGADLVIEMPALYATASAEYFATAGVGILDSLGCVDFISFGSEWATVEELTEVADILLEESPVFKKTLKEMLEEGKNYPQARETAVVACSGNEKYGEILDTPNHILGIEYIKALHRRKSKIQPVAIHREGSGYHEESWSLAKGQTGDNANAANVDNATNAVNVAYPSATALRHIIEEYGHMEDNIVRGMDLVGTDFEEEKKDILEYSEAKNKLAAGIPADADELWDHVIHHDMVTWDDLMPFLDYMVLMKGKVLGKYFGMDYDISRRISKLYVPGRTFAENMETFHSRNYTDAALRRILLHLVLQMKDYPFLEEAAWIPVPYARVLGFKKESGKILSMIREQGIITVIQRVVEGKELGKTDAVAGVLYDMDIRCADFYEQIAARKAGREPKKEIVQNPVMV